MRRIRTTVEASSSSAREFHFANYCAPYFEVQVIIAAAVKRSQDPRRAKQSSPQNTATLQLLLRLGSLSSHSSLRSLLLLRDNVDFHTQRYTSHATATAIISSNLQSRIDRSARQNVWSPNSCLLSPHSEPRLCLSLPGVVFHRNVGPTRQSLCSSQRHP